MPEGSENTILVLSEKGIGKRSELESYRITNRGGKGVKTMNITDRTGELVAFKSVNDETDLVIINKSGITIRIRVADIPVRGRATMGVKLIDLTKRGGDIASACCVPTDPEQEAQDLEIPEGELNAEAEEPADNEVIDDVEPTDEPEEEADSEE